MWHLTFTAITAASLRTLRQSSYSALKEWYLT